MSDATRFRKAGSAAANINDVLVLVLVSEFPPFRMVAVLLAPSRIEARRLNVSVGRGTDPDEFVGRWDAERLDAPYDGFVRDALAVLVVVGERSALPLSAIPRRGVAHVAQTLLGDG